MKFQIELASTIIEASTIYASTKDYCQSYFAEGESDFSVVVIPEDITFEQNQAAREDALEGLPIRKFSEATLEITALQRKIAEEFYARNILLFHGSVIAVDGGAYLFTAKSGTGKSTHTRLWREVFGDRAVMVNDDKPFLQLTENGVIAWGSPWNGKHRLGNNIGVPLKAICILERGETNKICPVSAAQALPMLMQQSQRPQDRSKLPLYLDLIDKLSSRTAFYRMQCNMDPEAAIVAYTAMSRKAVVER